MLSGGGRLLASRTRSRQRALAGDARAGSWARGQARRAQRRYVRTHWRLLGTGALLMLISPVLAAVLVSNALTRGFLLGTAVAGTVGVLAVWVLQVTGTAPTMMGDLAEQWTASELRPLRRAGWRLVNHVRLRPWDIDHVLIGPGGAWAVETKWSAKPWQLTPPEDRVRAAARQARDNARDLRLWTGFRSAGVSDVHPVVVLWGPGSAQLDVPPEGVDVDGVAVLPGPGLSRWRDRLHRDVLTAEQVDQSWQALDRQVRSADDRDRPVPLSLVQVGVAGALAVTAACVSMLTAARLLEVFGSMWVWAPACLALVVAVQPLRTRERTRLAALGWQAGLVAMVLLVSVLAVWELLT